MWSKHVSLPSPLAISALWVTKSGSGPGLFTIDITMIFLLTTRPGISLKQCYAEGLVVFNNASAILQSEKIIKTQTAIRKLVPYEFSIPPHY